MTTKKQSWSQVVNGERRDENNSGFAAYVGKRRVGWSLNISEAINMAVNAVKAHGTFHSRFVPSVTIFDCSNILNVGFITDDANGITYHPARGSRYPEGIRVQ